MRGTMRIHFTKMHGCGNDYVYINGLTERIPAEEKPEFVRRMSDRHFGIGGDGEIFINPVTEESLPVQDGAEAGEHARADFEMEMYNADGSRGQMCGNGIRCVAKYVYDHGLTGKTRLRILSGGSIKTLELSVKEGKVDRVRVNMGSPVLRPEEIPVIAEGEQAVSVPIELPEGGPAGGIWRMTCVSMGNPHAVVFVEDVAGLDLERIGPLFEHHPRFPQRINTEFVRVLDRHTVEMRVWERGSGETLACGTGCCATLAACVLNGLTDRRALVKVRGGELEIEWMQDTGEIFMTGPAETVFEGAVEYSFPG